MPTDEYPNLKPFKPGQSGNPGGKTSEQRRKEIENAEKATFIRGRLLDRIVKLIEEDPDSVDPTGDILKLIKDSEDRGLGQPKSTTEIGGIDGQPIPVQEIRRTIIDPADK